MAKHKSGQRHDVRRDIGELIGQPLPLQAQPHRVGEAEQRAGCRRIDGMGASEHHRNDSDPAPAGRHVFREHRDGAERELRAREPDQRAGGQNRDDAIAPHVHSERLGGVGLLADAPQPEADRGLEQQDRDDGDEDPGAPSDRRLASEAPAEERNGLQRRQSNAGEPDDRRVGESAADPEHRAQHFAVNMIRYLYNSGDLGAAQSFAELFIEVWSPATPEGDLQLLRAQRERANVLRSLGKFGDAYELDEATLRVATTTFGERDPFTLGMTSGFGADMRATGDFADALELDSRSLDTHREVLGAEHSQTLRAANNLAVDYGLNSRYPEARDLYAETYRRRSEGAEEYPAQEVLPSWSGLARALRLCGSYSEARDVGQDAYEYGVAALGAEHPRTLEAAIDLSIALRRIAVSYADAADLAQESSSRLSGASVSTRR